MARKPLYGRLDFFDGDHMSTLNHHSYTDKPPCFQNSNQRPEKKVSVPSPLLVHAHSQQFGGAGLGQEREAFLGQTFT